ncbi:intimin-like protein [Citrobacter freundii]|nr:intimin-like protein [Citrobacter freundii]
MKSALTVLIMGKPDGAKSTFTQDRGVIAATGADKAILTLTLKDSAGNPVSGIAARLSLAHTATDGLDAVSLTTDDRGNGVYEFSVTGTQPGTVVFTPQMDGADLTTTPATRTLVLTGDSSTAQITATNLTITTDNALADDSATNQVQAIVTDASGRPVSGVAVSFTTVAPAHITVSTGVTDIHGVATASLASPQSGPVAVTAKINSTGSEQTVDVNFMAGAPLTANSTLTVTPGSIVANGGGTGGTSLLTLTLKDAKGNPVTGLTDVVLTVSGVTDTALTVVSESPAGSGIYTTVLSGTTAGTATVGTTVSGVDFSATPSTVDVTLTPDLSTATVTSLTSTTNAALANNIDTQTLTATVKDANGNLVSGATVNFVASTGIATLSGATSTTNGSGQATVTVKDTTAETATLTAKVGTNAADTGKTVDTTFGLYPVVSGITQGVNNSPADSVTTNTLMVQVSDLAGNAIKNQGVTLNLAGTSLGTGPATLKYQTTVLTSASTAQAVTTDANGQVLLTATDITAETITVSMAVNNGSVAQTQTSTFALYPVVSSLTVGTNNVPADSTSLNTLVATITDKKGTSLASQSITLTLTADKGTATFTNTSPWTTTTNGSGQVTLSLKDNTVESVSVTAKAGTEPTGMVNSVYFTPNIAITVFNGGKTDGSQNGLMTAKVTNPTSGAPLSGMPVTLSVTSGAASIATTSGSSDGNGLFTSVVSSSTQGAVTIRAATSGGKTATANSGFLAPAFTGMTPPSSPTFGISSGFPNTGFVGAYFVLNLPTPFPTGSTWVASNPAVLSPNAADGTITMSGEPSGSMGTITVSYPGVSITSPVIYPNKWFKKTTVNQSGNYITDAPVQCAAMGSGYRQINVSDVTNAGIPSCNPGSVTSPSGSFPGTQGYLAGEFGGVSSTAADIGPSAQKCGNGANTLVWPYGSTGVITNGAAGRAGSVSWSNIQTSSKYLCVRAN